MSLALQGLACISNCSQQLNTGKHRLSGVRHGVGDIGEVMPMETFAWFFGECSLGFLLRLANNALQNGESRCRQLFDATARQIHNGSQKQRRLSDTRQGW